MKQINNNKLMQKDTFYIINDALRNSPERFLDFMQKNSFDINAKNEHGETLLMFAVLHYNVSTIKCVLAANPNLDCQNNKGATALLYATIESPYCYNALIEAGANIHIKDSDGADALLHACANSQFELVKTLVAKGVDVQSTCNEGNTALMYTIKLNSKGSLNSAKDDVKILEYLLKFNPDITIKNNTGETVFDLAQKRQPYESHDEIINLLNSYQENLELQNQTINHNRRNKIAL